MISIEKLIERVLEPLSDRNREIIVRRFGLESGQTETLESIGKNLGVSRERIRQIEKQALSNIMRKLPKEMDEFSQAVNAHLAMFHGVREEGRLLREMVYLLRETDSVVLKIRFLLFLDRHIFYFPKDEEHDAFWTNDVKFAKKVISFLKKLGESFRKRKAPVSVEEIEDYLAEFAKKSDLAKLDVGILISYLCLSRAIVFGPFGYIGTQHLKEIAPGNVGDKALLVLKNLQKPMHFRELTEVINNQAKIAMHFHPVWQKSVEAQTVHNELIKNQNFVLIGRGIYALQEWGYKPGTVREIISEILSKAGRPLSFKEIVERVNKFKIVKKATILINLQNKELFKRLPDKTYTLARMPKRVEQV